MVDSGPVREMTLSECVDGLPVEHLARRQYSEMVALLKSKDAEIARLRSGIRDVQDAIASRFAHISKLAEGGQEGKTE
jgi:hypothetical protein